MSPSLRQILLFPKEPRIVRRDDSEVFSGSLERDIVDQRDHRHAHQSDE